MNLLANNAGRSVARHGSSLGVTVATSRLLRHRIDVQICAQILSWFEGFAVGFHVTRIRTTILITFIVNINVVKQSFLITAVLQHLLGQPDLAQEAEDNRRFQLHFLLLRF